MARGNELKKFLREQRKKRDEREAKRREEVVRQNIEHRNRRRAVLTKAAEMIPEEVREYASVNTDVEPFMIVLNIPGCLPMWLALDHPNGLKATVFPPFDPADVLALPEPLTFPIRNAEDLTDAIAAAVIDEQVTR